MVQKHFVTFHSPGLLFADSSEKPISSWSVSEARAMAGEYCHGFRFTTRGREECELDSRVIKSSAMYYLGGEVLTVEQIERRHDDRDRILISNMRNNGYARVVRTKFGNTFPLEEGDVVI
jgi:hypothetical protein